jgi:cbb3-type cytochrome oxidase maturation protein
VSILYVLIPLGLVLLAFGIWAFFWAVSSGQFDDLDTPGWSVLIDHDVQGGHQDERPEDPPA